MRRLLAPDAAAYHRLRLDGFTRQPREFRVAPEDERALKPEDVAGRLERAVVAGAFRGHELVGIAGLTRFEGAKLCHRALLWGMYVRPDARGAGIGDGLMRWLMAEARAQGIEQVILTVAAENPGARRLYERWGFAVYGTEPRAIKLADGYMDELLMQCRLD